MRGEGWTLGAPRWLVLAYVLPIIYATIVYGLVWLSGLGGVDLSRFKTPVVTVRRRRVAPESALGDRRGARLAWLSRADARAGDVVPEHGADQRRDLGSVARSAHHRRRLQRRYADVVLGAVLRRDGRRRWASRSRGCRLRSRSVWPAAILHASHNLFVQAFFDRVTVDTGPTRWLTSEFGAGLALAFVAARVDLLGRAPVDRCSGHSAVRGGTGAGGDSRRLTTGCCLTLSRSSTKKS